ncbi:MAG: hypothetical protein KGS46_06960 [Chloroflexi bacterium]|jgi:hypothetical protein|nr:hypothetical protein [Chloroflexota bacterium]
MAHVDGKGQRFVPGSRKYDRSIEDALQTMERLALWIDRAKQENIWQELDDPIQIAALHGMLSHLQRETEALVTLGGEVAHNTAQQLRTLATQRGNNG